MTLSILCIGSLSRDVFLPYENIAILDTPEDTLAKQKMLFEVGAKYRAKDRYDAPGGCAANVSQGLARLGVDASLFANVGNDHLGETLLEEVRGEGVDTSPVCRVDGKKTDLGIIVVDKETGERTIFYNRDANESFSFPPEVFTEKGAVFVSGLYGDWRANIRDVARLAGENDCTLFYNPSASNIEDDAECVWEVAKKCEGVFLNKDEAMELLLRLHERNVLGGDFDKHRVEDEKYLATFLGAHLGVKFAVITDGARGAWAYDRSRDAVHFRSGHSVERVADATGAGDAFTSGFLASFLLGHSIETSLAWGIANATNVIRFYGAKEGLLRKDAMEGAA